jgi:hypothetical protein
MSEIGLRVIAVQKAEDGVVYSYGEGAYLGELAPESGFMKGLARNPCIKLDSGKYIWGYMCWWMSAEGWKKDHHPNVKEYIDVDVEENIKPMKNESKTD